MISAKCFQIGRRYLKFIYSEKATNFCEISNVDLSYVVTVKSTVEISQNFVAFSEYMNFNSHKGSYVTGSCKSARYVDLCATFSLKVLRYLFMNLVRVVYIPIPFCKNRVKKYLDKCWFNLKFNHFD